MPCWDEYAVCLDWCQHDWNGMAESKTSNNLQKCPDMNKLDFECGTWAANNEIFIGCCISKPPINIDAEIAYYWSHLFTTELPLTLLFLCCCCLLLLQCRLYHLLCRRRQEMQEEEKRFGCRPERYSMMAPLASDYGGTLEGDEEST